MQGLCTPANAVQDELHTQHDINALAEMFASAISPASPKLPLELAIATSERVSPASEGKQKYRVNTSYKLVQLNARVSQELRDQLREVASRKRLSLAALVASYCAAGLRRERL